MNAADGDAMRARLSATTNIAEALDGADLVIEAAPEKIDLKLSLMADIDRHAPDRAIIATNTSALSITEQSWSRKSPALSRDAALGRTVGADRARTH